MRRIMIILNFLGEISFIEALVFVNTWIVYVVILAKNDYILNVLTTFTEKIGITLALDYQIYDELEDKNDNKIIINDENHSLIMDSNDDSDIDEDSDMEYNHNETMKLKIAGLETVKHEIKYNNNNSHSITRINMNKLWIIVKYPYGVLFSYTIPTSPSESINITLIISFIISLIWMGFLTYLCVDSTSKIGHCLKLNEDVMGLTLLAIGSSLPDCFSSILVAKQGKGNMAISNALGSNIFDILICLGFSFLIGSIINKFKSIKVETNLGFELFIVSLFGLLIIYIILMWISNLILKKYHGIILIICYIIFISLFSYVLQND